MDNLLNKDKSSVVKKRELPFVLPKVRTYPYFTALVGILGVHNKEDIWIFNNYLLIWALKKLYHIDYWIDFKFGNEDIQKEFCPMINKTVLSRQFITDNYKSLKEAIKEFIDQEQYIFVSADVFYIDEWWGKRSPERHFRHQLCVSGYDYIEDTLTISDFIEGIYSTIKITYDKFEKGYNSYDKYVPYEDFGRDIWLLSYNKNGQEEISIERIYYLLIDFLNCSDTHIINYIQLGGDTDNYVYGLEIFDELIRYIEDVENNELQFIDKRPFHILLEMHRVMFWRLEYIFEKYYVAPQKEVMESVKQMIGETEAMQFLVLKYNLTNEKNIIGSLKQRLQEIVLKEKEMLEKCLHVIELVLNKEKTNLQE